MSELRDVFSPVACTSMTQFSPFPLHVHNYLYSGKTVTIINQRGVNVDMKRELYRQVIETTETRMKERHFRYATSGVFARVPTPILSARARKKSRKTTTVKSQAIAKREEQRLETKEDSESEAELPMIPEPVVEGPFRPSQRLLDFLKEDKTKSLTTTVSLPKTNNLQRQKTCNPTPLVKPTIRRLYLKLRAPMIPSPSVRKSLPRRSPEPDFISVAILGL